MTVSVSGWGQHVGVTRGGRVASATARGRFPPLTSVGGIANLQNVATPLTTPDISAYRAAARARESTRRAALEARRRRGEDLAREAAVVLRARFGATRVVLFGSALCPAAFHERSDVDLAAWGLTGPAYWAALAALEELDSTLTIDLVRAESARDTLLAVITAQGEAL
jgi:uncharacterized protein